MVFFTSKLHMKLHQLYLTCQLLLVNYWLSTKVCVVKFMHFIDER